MTTSLSEAAEIVAADLANRQAKGIDLPPSNPSAVAHHLAVAEGAPISLHDAGQMLLEDPANAKTVADHLRTVATDSAEEHETNLAVADVLDPPPVKPDRPERRFGSERRRAIAAAMFSKANYMGRRFDVITYTRKEKGAVSLTDFFENIATEADVQHVEYLLGIRTK